MIGIKNKPGFSLMEVIVAVALFSIIILSSTEIFRLVIMGQREAIASQNVQESLKYFFEVIGKEMRMAKKDNGMCGPVPDDQIFAKMVGSNSDTLFFRNFYDECVMYQLISTGDSQRFFISRGSSDGFISPAKIHLENLRFNIDSLGQTAVTMSLSASALGEGKEASEMDIQTTVTSRYYR